MLNADDYEQSVVDALFKATPISDDIISLASEHACDFVGVALGGSRSKLIDGLRVLFQPTEEPAPTSSRILNGGWLPARDAAFFNAAAGHFDDYDDDEPDLSIAHPTVTILTAAIAAADIRQVSGRELLHAYVMGVEFVMRLGRLVNPEHYRRGFHSTATLGGLGAAVSSGLLLRLDREQMRHAIGLAASMANGLRGNFGSDTKCLQVANAARNGVIASQLALAGATSTPGSLFGALGFLNAFSGQTKLALLDEIDHPRLFKSPGITVKAYPCCTCTHTAVDSLLDLMAERAFDPEFVEYIEIELDAEAAKILVHNQPRNALEGKFSMQFCIAAAVVHGRLGLGEFHDTVVIEPRVQSIMKRVRMKPIPGLPGPLSLASRLRVRFTDGTEAERVTRTPRGSSSRRLSLQQLKAKFISCASYVLGEQKSHLLFEEIMLLRDSSDAARSFDKAFSSPAAES